VSAVSTQGLKQLRLPKNILAR